MKQYKRTLLKKYIDQFYAGKNVSLEDVLDLLKDLEFATKDDKVLGVRGCKNLSIKCEDYDIVLDEDYRIWLIDNVDYHDVGFI